MERTVLCSLTNPSKCGVCSLWFWQLYPLKFPVSFPFHLLSFCLQNPSILESHFKSSLFCEAFLGSSFPQSGLFSPHHCALKALFHSICRYFCYMYLSLALGCKLLKARPMSPFSLFSLLHYYIIFIHLLGKHMHLKYNYSKIINILGNGSHGLTALQCIPSSLRDKIYQLYWKFPPLKNLYLVREIRSLKFNK